MLQYEGYLAGTSTQSIFIFSSSLNIKIGFGFRLLSLTNMCAYVFEAGKYRIRIGVINTTELQPCETDVATIDRNVSFFRV